ncbi:MAG: hypothetical protein P8X89_17400 [Reinekea sp.]
MACALRRYGVTDSGISHHRPGAGILQAFFRGQISACLTVYLND